MRNLLLAFAMCTTLATYAQRVENKCTPVRSQGNTGTCWCFSTVSVIESDAIRRGVSADIDISEMWIVRSTYLEKFKNYILRQGTAQFSEGALAHDAIRVASIYGLMPESAYSGTKLGTHNHQALFKNLKSLADSCVKKQVSSTFWTKNVNDILDNYLGKAPQSFTYKNATYTPQTFSKNVVKFNPKEYFGLTSSLSAPFFESWIVPVPDNFSNGSYFNLPIDLLLELSKDLVRNGYTLVWDADVSNRGFKMEKGIAMAVSKEAEDIEEEITQELREKRFLDLDVQDDHLMHIVGITAAGNFIVKNSWGKTGALNGFIEVTDNYFKLNTITVLISTESITPEMKEKFRL